MLKNINLYDTYCLVTCHLSFINNTAIAKRSKTLAMSQSRRLPYIHEKVANASQLSPELARMCLGAISPIKRQRLQGNLVVSTIGTDTPFSFPSIVQAKEAKFSDSPVTSVDVTVTKVETTSSLSRIENLRLVIPLVFKPLPHKHEMQSPKPITSARGMKRRRSVSDANA